MTVRPIDGTWSKFVWNLGEKSESLARKFREGEACLRDLRLAVDAQPTLTPPNEWVSVDEKLPEPGERVLATDCGFVGEFYINERGQWQRYNVNCHALLMALDILYWMPLPEPPDRRPPEVQS